MREPETRTSLPVHRADGAAAWPGRLRIDGLVSRPLDLTPTDLAAMPQQDFTDDFTCVEGWTVPALAWRGVPLSLILDMAGVRPQARWVQASAGDFSLPLPLEAAGAALLALRLGDEPLAPEHGGPVRLVVPGGVCYSSIKWLDRIELRHQPAANSGRAIALARLPGTAADVPRYERGGAR
jgi:DMSO/TMAO reductase YedYZ molybdopterin-dependent catalytic subunit